MAFAPSLQDNARRWPQCQNLDISGPLRALDAPPPSSPQRVLPPLQKAPGAPLVPARPLPANPALRQAQVCLPPLLWWMPLKSRPCHLPTSSRLACRGLYESEIIQLLRWLREKAFRAWRIVLMQHVLVSLEYFSVQNGKGPHATYHLHRDAFENGGATANSEAWTMKWRWSL